VIADGNNVAGTLFPVMAMTIDETSTWLAILSPFHVTFWNLTGRIAGPTVPVDNCGQRPEAFFFIPETPIKPITLVLVRRNGTLTELSVSPEDQSEDFLICSGPLINAQPLVIKGTLRISAMPHICVNFKLTLKM
jgi:hypothetical protein